jgi:hypothetical protein
MGALSLLQIYGEGVFNITWQTAQFFFWSIRYIRMKASPVTGTGGNGRPSSSERVMHGKAE